MYLRESHWLLKLFTTLYQTPIALPSLPVATRTKQTCTTKHQTSLYKQRFMANQWQLMVKYWRLRQIMFWNQTLTHDLQSSWKMRSGMLLRSLLYNPKVSTVFIIITYSLVHFFKTAILKRSRDVLLYIKKETSDSLSQWLINSCYFYLPRIFYERKYTITWLLWNATSRDVNIIVKLTYFRFDRLRITQTHIIIMATMKTGTICNIRGSNDDWRVIGTRFDGLVFRTSLSENCYIYLLALVQ